MTGARVEASQAHTVSAWLTLAPRPKPGKMYMLLHWLGYRSWPFTGTGSNGEPVATMARPSDHAYASAAVSSADDVGLDKGKIIGVSTC